MSELNKKSDILMDLINNFVTMRSERDSNEAYYGQNGIELLREIIKAQHETNLEYVKLWNELKPGGDSGIPPELLNGPDDDSNPSKYHDHNILVIGGSDNPKYYGKNVFTVGNHNKAWYGRGEDWNNEDFWITLGLIVQSYKFNTVYVDEGSYCHMNESTQHSLTLLINDMIDNGQKFSFIIPIAHNTCNFDSTYTRLLNNSGFTTAGFIRFKKDIPEGWYYKIMTNDPNSYFSNPGNVFFTQPVKRTNYIEYSDETTGIYEDNDIVELLSEISTHI